MVKNKKLIHLYEEANGWKIFYKLILPALLITLSLGIYVFFDQLLLVLILPTNPNFTFNDVFKINGYTDAEAEIKRIISDYPQYNLTFYDVSAIVKTANAISLPITAILEVVPYLIGVGAATYYAKNLALKKTDNLKKIFNSSIWFCIWLGIIINLIVGLISYPVSFSLNGSKLSEDQYQFITNPVDRKIYVDYYNNFQYLTALYASEYLVVLSFSIIFSLISYNISLILRCEAKNLITILVVIITNVVNLLLNFVFLKFSSLGMMGASTATTIGFILSCVILFSYLFFIRHKQHLHFSIKDFNFKRSNLEMRYFWRILIISLSTFLYNVSYSIVFSIFTIFLIKSTNELTPSLGAQYFQNLIGAVKPISALIFIGLGGIIDGSRSIATYCREAGNYKRFEKIIWLSLFISFIYSAFFYFVFAYALRYPLALLFSIATDQINDYNLMLLIVIAELPCSLFSVPNLIYFQASRKTIWSNISSVFLILSCVILIYPFKIWGYQTGKIDGVFNLISFQPFNDLLGSLLMFGLFLFFDYGVDKNRVKWFTNLEVKYNQRFFKIQERTKML